MPPAPGDAACRFAYRHGWREGRLAVTRRDEPGNDRVRRARRVGASACVRPCRCPNIYCLLHSTAERSRQRPVKPVPGPVPPDRARQCRACLQHALQPPTVATYPRPPVTPLSRGHDLQGSAARLERVEHRHEGRAEVGAREPDRLAEPHPADPRRLLREAGEEGGGRSAHPGLDERHVQPFARDVEGPRAATAKQDEVDYLVRRAVPFRDAHEAVGRAVRSAVETGRDLSEMTLDELRTFSPVIEKDVFEVLTLEGSVAARDHPGGTAPARVHAAIARARERLGSG